MPEHPKGPFQADWKAPQALPDGRVVEYLWTVADDCGVPVPAGHMRLLVHVTIDGEAAVLPVLLTPEDIARVASKGGYPAVDHD